MPTRVPVEALRDPIPLAPNRIERFYRGGRMLGRFRDDPDAADDGRPEDWVGSATASWTPPGTAPTTIGISRVEVGPVRTTIAELVATHPEAMVGRPLLEHAGPTAGVLVKLLDAGERLPVHAHPTREAAARSLGSRFGKTEAWLILATRDGRPATVWAGLNEPVEPTTFRHWIESEDSDALLASLATQEVEPGDVLLIRGGTPHAVGDGILLLELQEPTDFSVVAETRGFPIDSADASLGLGWDLAIGLFDLSAEAIVRRRTSDQPAELPAEADAFFRLRWQRAEGPASLPFEPTYAVGIVMSGQGTLHGATTAVPLRAGRTLAVPAEAVPHARLEPMQPIEIAWCLGPDPAALDVTPLPSIGA
jgi:mannose-6-phosphate isomerase